MIEQHDTINIRRSFSSSSLSSTIAISTITTDSVENFSANTFFEIQNNSSNNFSRSRVDLSKYGIQYGHEYNDVSQKEPTIVKSTIPPPPPPSDFNERFYHSLPLPIHLIRTTVSTSCNMMKALCAHILDGPLGPGWSLSTSVLHAGMKSFIKTHPPQSRHGLSLIRYLTSFPFPLIDCYFSSVVNIEPRKLNVNNPALLDHFVCSAVDCHPGIIISTKKKVPENKRILEAEFVTNRDCHPEKLILYLHGGAHIFMSPRTHRGITSKIVKKLNMSVLSIDYRLCPEHLFPSAISDALAFYIALIGKTDLDNVADEFSNTENNFEVHFQHENHNDSSNKDTKRSTIYDPSNVILMGDSSGGCLTLQLLHVLKYKNLPLPAGAILLSPFVDHTCSMDSWKRNWESDFMTLDYLGVKWALSIYANGLDLTHPVVSPIFDNFKGYPPILIQSGDSEVLTDDSIKLFERMSQDGVAVKLELFKGMFHVFHAFPTVKSSGEAFDRIHAFLKGIPRFHQEEKNQVNVVSIEPQLSIVFAEK